MEALFIHDHPFYYDDEDHNYYSQGGLPYTTWERYLSVFDRLTVVGRLLPERPNKMIVSSFPGVKFSLLDKISSKKDYVLKRNHIKSILTELLIQSPFAIIRLPSNIGYLAVNVCRRNKIPYILEVVGCPYDALRFYGSFLGRVMAPIELIIMRQIVKYAPHVIYVTQKFLQHRYPSYGNIIGISNVRLEKIDLLDDVAKFYNRSLITFEIALIGSFNVRYKGHLEAVRAVNDLVKKHGIRNVRLNLIGSGNTSWIENEIGKLKLESFINIVGPLEAGEKGVLPFLRQIHLFLQPSKTEGLPRTLIEALSCGRLAIASNVGGIPELLSGNFLYDPNEPDMLSKKIMDVYSTPESWAAISKGNLDTASRYLEQNLQDKRRVYLNSIMDKYKVSTNSM